MLRGLIKDGVSRKGNASFLGCDVIEQVGGEEEAGGGSDGHEGAEGARGVGGGEFFGPDAADAFVDAELSESLADVAGEGTDFSFREIGYAKIGGIAFAGGAHGGPNGVLALSTGGEERHLGGDVVNGIENVIGLDVIEEGGDVFRGDKGLAGGGCASWGNVSKGFCCGVGFGLS